MEGDQSWQDLQDWLREGNRRLMADMAKDLETRRLAREAGIDHVEMAERGLYDG